MRNGKVLSTIWKKIDAALPETSVTIYQARGPNIPEVLEPNN
jgi:hypothetical protein